MPNFFSQSRKKPNNAFNLNNFLLTMKTIEDSSTKNQQYLQAEKNDLMMKKLELEN